MEGLFRKFRRGARVLLETVYGRKCALDFIVRQCVKNPMNLFDLCDAMANHGKVISRGDGEADCFFETVLIENRSHIEIISHNQPIEAELIMQQLGDDAARQGGWCLLRLEIGIPAMTDHHAIDGVLG